MKRNKNDAIDAEAIAEAAQRPGMRFVAVKSEEQQAAGLVFRTRDLAVRQRTQLINAIRGHLAEYGWVAPRGTAHMTMLADLLEDEEMTSSLPAAARPMFKLMVDMLADLDKQIAVLDREIARRAKEDEAARRLMTIPGIGPIAATAIIALAPPVETFRKGRDFAAWLGLAPRQHSTGGKQRLGSISKMGERTIRRLLIIGGSSMVRQACRFITEPGRGMVVELLLTNLVSARQRGVAPQLITLSAVIGHAIYPCRCLREDRLHPRCRTRRCAAKAFARRRGQVPHSTHSGGRPRHQYEARTVPR